MEEDGKGQWGMLGAGVAFKLLISVRHSYLRGLNLLHIKYVKTHPHLINSYFCC